MKTFINHTNNLTSNRVLTYFKLLVYTKKLGGFVARACSTGSSTGPKFSNVLSLGTGQVLYSADMVLCLSLNG